MAPVIRWLSIVFVVSAFAACDQQLEEAVATPTDAVAAAQVDTDRIKAAATEPEMWLTYGGGYDEQRHSALGQINRDTLPELGIGWVYDGQAAWSGGHAHCG